MLKLVKASIVAQHFEPLGSELDQKESLNAR